MMTGCRCGEGTTLSGPLTLKNLPTWLMARTLRGSATTAGLAVPHEGVGIDAVPQGAADVDEFLQPVVALVVVDQLVVAVVGVVGPPLRGDDVEGDPSVGDVVERVEQARRVERVHEGRRIGEPEPQMVGHPRHQGDEWAHVEARPRDAVAHRVLDRALPGVRDAGAVAEEDHVEAAALGDARDLLEHADIGMMTVDPGAGQPPMRLDVGPRQVEREMDFLLHALSDAVARLPTGNRGAFRPRRRCNRDAEFPQRTVVNHVRARRLPHNPPADAGRVPRCCPKAVISRMPTHAN